MDIKLLFTMRFKMPYFSLTLSLCLLYLECRALKLSQGIDDKLSSLCPLFTHCDASALQAQERMRLKIKIPTEDVDS